VKERRGGISRSFSSPESFFRRPPLDVEGCYEPFNLAVIADQKQTRTRRTRQPWPSQKRCVTHSQLPKS